MSEVNKMPELLNDFRAYFEGENDCLGLVSVKLPSIQNMTKSLDGIGLGGEMDAPVRGHYKSFETTLNWRIPTDRALKIVGGDPVALEVRGAVQNWDSGGSNYKFDSIRVVIRGRVKSFEIGTAKANETMDSNNTIETSYIKYAKNSKTILEIDKYGYKDVLNGNDRLADIRAALGL